MRLTPAQYERLVIAGGGVSPVFGKGVVRFVDPETGAAAELFLAATNEPDDVRAALIRARERLAEKELVPR